MNLPVRYYVVPGRMLYRNSDGIISYPVTQLILRHAIISHAMMIYRTLMSYPVMPYRKRPDAGEQQFFLREKTGS